MPDVITLGDINIDIVAPIPAYPSRGGDIVAEGASLHTGGSAVNTAIALACLGVDVGFIGRVGQDALAAQALADLADAGVDTRLVQFDPAISTGIIFIAVTPDGERTMFGARGANSYTDPQLLDEDYFAGAKWFHFSGYTLLAEPQRSAALYALEIATEAGSQISLDVSIDPVLRARHNVQRLLSRVDVIFPNETELSLLTRGVNMRQAPAQLLKWGVGAVAAKYGANGSEVSVPNLQASLPAFNISPLDTTGAGDCFDAGFILGRLLELDWEVAAVLGNAVGALSTQWQGAGAGRVTPKAVYDLIEMHLDQPAWLKLRQVLEEALVSLENLT
jgi:ribokinase